MLPVFKNNVFDSKRTEFASVPFSINLTCIFPSSVPSVLSDKILVISPYTTSWSALFSPRNCISPSSSPSAGLALFLLNVNFGLAVPLFSVVVNVNKESDTPVPVMV